MLRVIDSPDPYLLLPARLLMKRQIQREGDGMSAANDPGPAGRSALTRQVAGVSTEGDRLPANAEGGTDMLVVGSRGHGAFAGMLLGSVSQHCIRHAPCAVVVMLRCHPRESNQFRLIKLSSCENVERATRIELA
jgi:nucleotide-binding universal stress UspA family protein